MSRAINSKSYVTLSSLRALGFASQAMVIAGFETVKMLRDEEQEFILRPRVTSEVHLLKFRTVFTSREVIIRYSTRTKSNLLVRFIDHDDRFLCDGTTRKKVREIVFDTTLPNMARRMVHLIHYDIMPWLRLSADNLRKPSIRLPVKRETIDTKSRFLPASFKVVSFKVAVDSASASIVLFAKDNRVSFTIPMAQNLVTRLQDPDNVMHLVVFANGNHLVIDEATFLREFIYIDEIETTQPTSQFGELQEI